MKLSLLSTLASGIFALAVGSATGITTHLIGEQVNASVAEAKTVEVLQATATRIAEQKERMTPAVIVTIPISNDQMNNAQGIPLHEAPTADVLGASSTYNTTVYPTSIPSLAVVPPAAATVIAAFDATAGGTVTPAVATPQPTASAWPSGTPSATPVVLAIETLEATADERTSSVTATPTPFPTEVTPPTITENPTPSPTDVPKATVIPTPLPVATDTPTMEPTQTDAPTITPQPVASATDGPLVSPLATPTMSKTETPAP